MSGSGTGISIGLQSPGNTLTVSNSPVGSSVGVIDVDLVAQEAVTPGVYTNPSLSVNAQGVITSIAGNTSALNAVSLTSQAGTLTVSNSTITGAQNTCNLDLQPVANVAGVYTSPNLVVDIYGRVVAATSNPPLPGTGTVTSVGLTSVGGTMAVSSVPVTGEGVLNVDLAPVSGLPTTSVPCAAVGVDGFGRVTSLEGGSFSLGSPQKTLQISKPAMTDTSMTLNVDVAATGVGAGTYLTPFSMQVSPSGQIQSVQGSSCTGIVQNVTSTGGSLVVSPGGGTQGTNQCTVNVDLPADPSLAGVYNGIRVNQFGVVTGGINEQYLNQVNVSSALGTLQVSNGAVTQQNPGTIIDLSPVPAVEGVYAVNTISSIQVNAYGQITAVNTNPPAPPQSRWYVVDIGYVAITWSNYAFLVETNIPASFANNNTNNIFVSCSSTHNFTGPGSYGEQSYCPDISAISFSSNNTIQFLLFPGNQGDSSKDGTAGVGICYYVWIYGVPSWA